MKGGDDVRKRERNESGGKVADEKLKAIEWVQIVVAVVLFMVFLGSAYMVFTHAIPSASDVLNMSCDQQTVTERCGLKQGSAIESKQTKGVQETKGSCALGEVTKTEKTTCWPKVAALLVTVLGGLGMLGLVGHLFNGLLRTLEY